MSIKASWKFVVSRSSVRWSTLQVHLSFQSQQETSWWLVLPTPTEWTGELELSLILQICGLYAACASNTALYSVCCKNAKWITIHSQHLQKRARWLARTGCPRKQFTLFDNALILKLLITQVGYYTHFEADIASFKMSTHSLHRYH